MEFTWQNLAKTSERRLSSNLWMRLPLQNQMKYLALATITISHWINSTTTPKNTTKWSERKMKKWFLLTIYTLIWIRLRSLSKVKVKNLQVSRRAGLYNWSWMLKNIETNWQIPTSLSQKMRGPRLNFLRMNCLQE